jgi:hypothetical protein
MIKIIATLRDKFSNDLSCIHINLGVLGLPKINLGSATSLSARKTLRPFGWHILAYLGLSWLIFSHRILFILPAEHYSFYQPSTIHSAIPSLFYVCTVNCKVMSFGFLWARWGGVVGSGLVQSSSRQLQIYCACKEKYNPMYVLVFGTSQNMQDVNYCNGVQWFS